MEILYTLHPIEEKIPTRFFPINGLLSLFGEEFFNTSSKKFV
ncbi:hypothetical protein LEP1GSC043_3649 [Leptospira weilii str. Ecochallenge]|uniref:Uncharacterized protein n=1 Tax=Leptospira weilii str. Ecochallenge TaxID=1049986 RepID=N1U8A2_9LEPT|nr:hypothetical protein LEP1GSC043_3649 [Leptospira weilii str. Ecochallenge]